LWAEHPPRKQRPLLKEATTGPFEKPVAIGETQELNRGREK
jgi:hypothetical protein